MHRLDIKDPYQAMFIDETREQLEQMEQELLNLESGRADNETINIIFRMAHSIKGSAATMELAEITEIAHLLESLFMKVKGQEIALEAPVMNTILEALDTLKSLHRYLWDDTAEVPDMEVVSSKIKLLIGETPKAKGKAERQEATVDEIFTDEELEIIKESKSNSGKYKVVITLNDDAELKGVKAYIICHNFEDLGEILSVAPSDYENLADEEFGCKISLLLATEEGEEVVRRVLNSVTELKETKIISFRESEIAGDEERKATKPADVIPIKDNEAKNDRRVDEKTSVKVNINKINKLINLMGEFVVDKEALNKLSMELKKKYKKDPSVIRLIDVFTHISYLGSELEELVLSTRMLPLENIFNKLPRMVRDLALKCNKNVNFIIEGKETGIDRGIIEELVDPLNHILRNCIDHGLEPEEERIRNGKNPSGTIKLSASQGENHVVITIQDDGKGIDVSRVREKALENKLIGKEESETLSDEDIIKYIFEPGFSTAREVSEISGRGVGLDVVKSNIGKLNGIIDINTAQNEGTTFTIKLPLTLAIIKAMLIKEGPCTFAIPVASIVEIIRLKGKEHKELIHDTGKNEVFSWRDQAIPLVRMEIYFELDSQSDPNKMFIIVVGNGERKMALVAERVIGEQEIVIKSMGDFVGKDKLLGEIQGVSGVSILGDGSFAQIVDIAAMIRK
jgi:two-component system chemotaxis sensor kinase CheA